jgi:hypothetical protein
MADLHGIAAISIGNKCYAEQEKKFKNPGSIRQSCFGEDEKGNGAATFSRIRAGRSGSPE